MSRATRFKCFKNVILSLQESSSTFGRSAVLTTPVLVIRFPLKMTLSAIFMALNFFGHMAPNSLCRKMKIIPWRKTTQCWMCITFYLPSLETTTPTLLQNRISQRRTCLIILHFIWEFTVRFDYIDIFRAFFLNAPQKALCHAYWMT